MRGFTGLLNLACLLALAVILLGAHVRLTDAGLGCPDWPGCYGHLASLPETAEEIRAARAQDPRGVYDAGAAAREMTHRYAAALLGLLGALLAGLCWSRHGDARLRAGMLALLALLAAQSLLGMWTVTLRLQPLIVTLHLLGGFATLSLLWWMRMRHLGQFPPLGAARPLRALAALAVAALLAQIALGGWTSANYAALACPDFPLCRGQWWPDGMDFAQGFVLWRGAGIDYEFGVLDSPARTAVHVAHRTGAAATALAVLLLGAGSVRSPQPALRRGGVALLILLAAQIALGAANVLLHLPLGVALAHNAGALALLLAALTQWRQTRAPRRA